MTIRAIVIHPDDDVAVMTDDVAEGEAVIAESSSGPMEVTARQDIPTGHKIALRDLAVGSPVCKYGERIGHAIQEIHAGDHVHLHNLASERVQASRA